MQIATNKCIFLIIEKNLIIPLLIIWLTLIFYYLYTIFYLDNLIYKNTTSCDYHVNPVDNRSSSFFINFTYYFY